MKTNLLFKYRVLLAGFIVGVVLAGATAFPLTWEIALLAKWLTNAPIQVPGLTAWVVKVSAGLTQTDARFPFLAYGTDWLAFAHLMIAIAYIGPWREPARNRWVLEWGLICCAGVLPLAIICGPIRGIPWGWTLVDCAFSLVGAPVLWTFCGAGRKSWKSKPGRIGSPRRLRELATVGLLNQMQMFAARCVRSQSRRVKERFELLVRRKLRRLRFARVN